MTATGADVAVVVIISSLVSSRPFTTVVGRRRCCRHVRRASGRRTRRRRRPSLSCLLSFCCGLFRIQGRQQISFNADSSAVRHAQNEKSYILLNRGCDDDGEDDDLHPPPPPPPSQLFVRVALLQLRALRQSCVFVLVLIFLLRCRRRRSTAATRDKTEQDRTRPQHLTVFIEPPTGNTLRSAVGLLRGARPRPRENKIVVVVFGEPLAAEHDIVVVVVATPRSHRVVSSVSSSPVLLPLGRRARVLVEQKDKRRRA